MPGSEIQKNSGDLKLMRARPWAIPQGVSAGLGERKGRGAGPAGKKGWKQVGFNLSSN